MKHFRFVRWQDIHVYHAKGWVIEDVCPGHHGHHAVLMVWLCSCPVPA